MMQQEHGYIRSIDVAEHLGVTKPSVSYATKRLRENGYITMDREGFITLTDSGMAIAASMLDRHHTLTRFLITLGWTPRWRRRTPARSSTTSATRPLPPSAPTPCGTARRNKRTRIRSKRRGRTSCPAPPFLCWSETAYRCQRSQRRCALPLRPVAAAAGAAGSLHWSQRGPCGVTAPSAGTGRSAHRRESPPGP